MPKPTPNNPELEQAMKEAMDSVEKKETRDDDTDERAGVVDAARVRAAQSAPRPSQPPAPEAGPTGEPMTSPPDQGDPARIAQGLSQAQRELTAALEKARSDSADLKDKWLRAAADLENYRKRSARERDEAVKFGNEKLLRELLPVLDDLDRTVEAIQTSGTQGPTSTLLEGLRLVQKKFLAQLERNGVESFGAVGQPFDPSLHEAVQQVYADDVPAGAVAQEVRRGFNLSGRLLRPALVAVSLGPKPQ